MFKQDSAHLLGFRLHESNLIVPQTTFHWYRNRQEEFRKYCGKDEQHWLVNWPCKCFGHEMRGKRIEVFFGFFRQKYESSFSYTFARKVLRFPLFTQLFLESQKASFFIFVSPFQVFLTVMRSNNCKAQTAYPDHQISLQNKHGGNIFPQRV